MFGRRITKMPSEKLLSDPPPRQILPPERIDDVAQAVIAVTRELWVAVDRMTILEKVLSTNGIDISAAIDAYQPDDAVQAELEAKRARVLLSVLRALKADI
jgi:hypothetical protein